MNSTPHVFRQHLLRVFREADALDIRQRIQRGVHFALQLEPEVFRVQRHRASLLKKNPRKPSGDRGKRRSGETTAHNTRGGDDESDLLEFGIGLVNLDAGRCLAGVADGGGEGAAAGVAALPGGG